jgi:hypothetical protein
MFPTRLQRSPDCFSVPLLRTIDCMRDGKGNERDLWVMVDHDGDRTLFKLVEMGSGGDVLELARELHAPAVVVDMPLPALPAPAAVSGGGQSGNARLILLNVRTVTPGAANGVVVRRSLQGEPPPPSTGRQGDARRARSESGPDLAI